MTTSTIHATIDVVATAQVHGGTRVITLTVETNDIGVHVATLRAYDSNHPSDEFVTGVYGDADRTWVVETATQAAIDVLRLSVPAEPCDCWVGWDPYCGQPGCWGVYHPLAKVASNS